MPVGIGADADHGESGIGLCEECGRGRVTRGVMRHLEQVEWRAAGADAAHQGFVGARAVSREEEALPAGLDQQHDAVLVGVSGERSGTQHLGAQRAKAQRVSPADLLDGGPDGAQRRGGAPRPLTHVGPLRAVVVDHARQSPRVVGVGMRHDDGVQAADAEGVQGALDGALRSGRAAVDEDRPRAGLDDLGVPLADIDEHDLRRRPGDGRLRRRGLWASASVSTASAASSPSASASASALR